MKEIIRVGKGEYTHYENGVYTGSMYFSKTLLCSAVAAAAGRVEGVVRLKSDFWFVLRNLLRRGMGRRGVVVRPVGYNTIVIEVCFVCEIGYSSADLSYRVQEAVLSVAQNKSLTDKRIKRVDVRICGAAAAQPSEIDLVTAI
ncbi:MAG: Asp23/Gls24 family envelope stress response protein [Firmicutes bacterium]|nr:Asp23/Gls24 family envelope stress response protein [Bacillota bacterium]